MHPLRKLEIEKRALRNEALAATSHSIIRERAAASGRVVESVGLWALVALCAQSLLISLSSLSFTIPLPAVSPPVARQLESSSVSPLLARAGILRWIHHPIGRGCHLLRLPLLLLLLSATACVDQRERLLRRRQREQHTKEARLSSSIHAAPCDCHAEERERVRGRKGRNTAQQVHCM